MAQKSPKKRSVQPSAEAVSFTWPGKQAAHEQATAPTDQMRKSVKTIFANPDPNNGIRVTNIFIEGDNLDALKLMNHPLSHQNKVKMIYIDPPYNTGKEFVYSDYFADSAAWLNMIYPRLILAHQLLREDGVMFVSIDDREVHRLRMVLDEIFGVENFVSTIIWEKKYAPQNDARWLSENHDYVLLYAKNKQVWRPNLLPRTDAANARFKNPDNDPRGPWKAADFSVRTYTSRCDYPITVPSGRIVTPPQGRCWTVTQERYEELVADNRVWFGKTGNNVPAMKKFLSEVKQGMTSLTIWKRDEVGDTQSARKQMRELFGNSRVFDTPKPVGLIRRMLQLATTADGDEYENIVLDFFAGSATTAHAVIEQNAADGGKRRFVTVQLPVPLDVEGFSTLTEVGLARIKKVLVATGSIERCQYERLVKEPDESAKAFTHARVLGS
ncbi:MAG: site-specific DNA-methyltransferase [Anaerolineae bacterium]